MKKNPRAIRTRYHSMYWAGFVFLAACVSSFGQNVTYTPYLFTTLAGESDIGNVDGTNSAARFNEPRSIAVDKTGNLYVADPANETIRKLTPSGTNWIVTTIAGTPGLHGNGDGPGASAQFYGPDGITVDANGNVYVADSSNADIRKLTPDGTNWIVTTIAGTAQSYGDSDGTNGDAQFSDPEGIAADAAGNLYVADSGNNLIRKLTPSGTNWIITTIAGQQNVNSGADGMNTNATFNSPRSIASDSQGNLFVSDSLNNTIRKIVLVGTDWVVTTIAGQIGNANSADGTGTNALFDYPNQLTVDANGNVFVADAENYTIRKLAPVGTNYVVTTPVGLTRNSGSTDGTNSDARFYFATGVAADAAGNFYVADYQNAEIRKATQVGTNWVVTTLAGFAQGVGSKDGTNTAALFNNSAGVAVDRFGTVFVADQGNHVIRKLVLSGSNWIVTTIAGQAGHGADVDGVGTNALFDAPYGIAVDTNGNIFVTDQYGNTVRRLTPTGTNYTTTTVAGLYGTQGSRDGTNSFARFQDPMGIAVDSKTNLFVVDSFNATIRKLTPSGTNWIVTTIAGQVGNFGFNDAIGTNALFNYPAGITVDHSGNLYVADAGNDLIRKLTPNGTNYLASTVAGDLFMGSPADGTNSDAHFNYPQGIAVDGNGQLFIADYTGSTIRKAVLSGKDWIVTTAAGEANSGSSADGLGMFALFNHPLGIAVDSNGALFVTDTYNSTIRKGVAAIEIVLGAPVVNDAQLDLPFIITSGSPSSFKLLQTPALGGSWTTNNTAVLSTNSPGLSYKFTVAFPNGPGQFYRIQTP